MIAMAALCQKFDLKRQIQNIVLKPFTHRAHHED